MERTLIATDGIHLRTRRFSPSRPAKATVLITHGMGEHSGRYWHVAEHFVKAGYEVITYDLRGHGFSEGRRGDIRDYNLFLEDLQLVLKQASENRPLFLYGHSLGGQIVINHLASRHAKVAGCIIASPWLALAFRPPALKLFLARILVHLWPTFTQRPAHNSSALSRDQTFLASMRDLHLTHRTMSARMFARLTEGAARALASAPEFTIPFLLIHGECDELTSASATQDFFRKAAAEDKTLKLYPNMLHECHNEFGRESVLAEMSAWLDSRLAHITATAK